MFVKSQREVCYQLTGEIEYLEEFRYRNPIITEKDVVLAISQSGETADTLAAMRLAKEKGATVLAICNVVGSSIARLSDAGAYTHAGPEIGVASTKAFTAQVTILTLISLLLARKKTTISESYYRQLLIELEMIPIKVENMLSMNNYIKEISAMFVDAQNFLYLGRGYNFPVALEGALKLKEISYIHAEGYPAAEMKHGPIALIDENMPIVVIATKKGHYEKVVSNIQEVKARNGIIIAIVTHGDTKWYVLHAEANAIMKVARSTNDCKGATLYLTLSPCKECCKLIHQSGIKRLVYLNEYKDTTGLDFLKKANVELLHFQDAK